MGIASFTMMSVPFRRWLVRTTKAYSGLGADIVMESSTRMAELLVHDLISTVSFCDL